MKKLLKLFSLVSIALFISSCDLNLVPIDAIELEDGFRTYQDAERFANGLHSRVRGLHHGVFSQTSELQGDMFNAAAEFGNRGGSVHRLDASLTTSEYNFRDVWKPTYKAIMNINSFIDNVDHVEIDVQHETAQRALLNKYKGWAYFYRAYTYHELVRRFAKDYDQSTAATDLGVPLMLHLDVETKPARATLKATYEQILKDLDQADEFLKDVKGVVGAETPTRDAAKALRTRVYFYMGNYGEAATLAKELISSGTYTLASSESTMEAEYVYDSGKETIMQFYADIAEHGGNHNDIYLGYQVATKTYKPDFIPTQATIDMYETDDLRFQFWFKEYPVKFTLTDTLYLFNKYYGNPDLNSSPSRPNYRHKVKPFAIAEMYLIAAEAYLQQSSPNASEALLALNDLQTARNATPSPSATMDEVKKEWAKETIGLGVRIDCLKRWGDGYSGRPAQNVDFITNNPPSNYTEKVVLPTEPKLVWAIPQIDMDINPNLIQNEGWGAED